MMQNRSVPVSTILPHIYYRNVDDAIVWLTATFGFEEHYRYGTPGEPISGAQMHRENAWIMLVQVRPGASTPAQTGHRTQSLTIFVENVNSHFQNTKSAGAKIVEDLHETIYGEHQYGVEDLDGHHWLFSQHARDISPEEWGAIMAAR